LIADEWGNWFTVEPGTNPAFLFQQNTLRDAVTAGLYLNIFNNHCERVKMANLAQTVNVLQSVILTNGADMVLTPTYYVFKLFKAHQDALMLPVDMKSADYAFDGKTVPAVTVSASRDANGLIHISLTNADPNQSQAVTIDLRGRKVSTVRGDVITADSMNAFNDFGKPEAVSIHPFDGAKLKGQTVEFSLPAKSVVMLALK
jgi:alpha-N-arabinofuranosidase